MRRKARRLRAHLARHAWTARRIATLALCVTTSTTTWACVRTIPAATAEEECRAGMVMPISDGTIIAPYDGPAQAWLPGHRGIDIRARQGAELLAPASGVISHAGTVGGKATVSIRVRTRTLTFEPARTTLSVGTPVMRGTPFATVDGSSDHCDDACVHWGIKLDRTTYEDPARWLTPQSVRLVPTA